MGPHIPVLTTDRLVIRPFEMDDLADIHRILDLEAFMEPQPLEERRRWLEWSVRNYVELEKLYQPPYGDRAIVRREDHRLLGSVGLVPQMGPYGQLSYFSGANRGGQPPARRTEPPTLTTEPAAFTTEMGLFWALENAARGHGYATEAARAFTGYIFEEFNMARLVATTEYDNLPSQRVMERLGMRLERNPLPEPEWFQVIGILEKPG